MNYRFGFGEGWGGRKRKICSVIYDISEGNSPYLSSGFPLFLSAEKYSIYQQCWPRLLICCVGSPDARFSLAAGNATSLGNSR